MVMSIFQTEQALVNPLQQRDRETLLSLGFAAIVSTIAPIVFSGQLPTAVKTASLFCGVGTSAAAAIVSGNKIARKQNKFARIIDDTQEDALLSTMEAEIAYSKMLGDIYNNNRILDIVQQLPQEQHAYWFKYFGVDGLASAAAQTIAIEAQAILETPEAAPYAQAVRSISPAAVGKAYSNQPDLPFPEEDLALTLAQTTIDPDQASSTLIACPRGTGKSTLLRQAIAYANEIHEGAIDFSVFAGKDGETYCGLETSASDYLYSGSKDNAFETYRRLNAITEERCETFAGFPTIQILDEYNNTLAATKTSDKIKKGQNYHPLISGTTYERVTKGRSKLCLDWMTSHSPLVKDVDLNSQIQNSVFTVVLARGSSYGTIEDALKNKIQVVDNSERREELREQLQQYRNSPKFDRDRVLALTNMLGDWRIVFLPRYGKVEDIDRDTLNQSIEEIEADVWGDDDPAPTGKPGESPFDVMQLWLDQLHYVPTDEEIIKQFKLITGQVLDAGGLRLLKEGLGLSGNDEEAIAP